MPAPRPPPPTTSGAPPPPQPPPPACLDVLADKVFVHRWPHDTPEWDASTVAELDRAINRNPGKKRVAIRGGTVGIGGFEFTSLRNVGVSVPFFKGECRVIFEARFGRAGRGRVRQQRRQQQPEEEEAQPPPLHAHVHITVRSPDFAEIFGGLESWRRSASPGPSGGP